MSTAQTLTLTRPDDWHLHVRDGAALAAVVPHTAAQFGRAIIMPNLRPPVTTTAQALAYKARIAQAVPAQLAFEPLMTLYLTDVTPADEIARARDAGIVALKLYPAGATTNSDAGVTDIRKTYPTLEAMQRAGHRKGAKDTRAESGRPTSTSRVAIRLMDGHMRSTVTEEMARITRKGLSSPGVTMRKAIFLERLP